MTLDLAKAFVATDFDGDFVPLDNGAVLRSTTTFPSQQCGDASDARRCLRTVLMTGSRRALAAGRRRRCSRRRSLKTLVESGAVEDVTIKLADALQLSGDTGLESKGPQVNLAVVDPTHINGVANGRPHCVHAG